jgi:hypothetical protein
MSTCSLPVILVWGRNTDKRRDLHVSLLLASSDIVFLWSVGKVSQVSEYLGSHETSGQSKTLLCSFKVLCSNFGVNLSSPF